MNMPEQSLDVMLSEYPPENYTLTDVARAIPYVGAMADIDLRTALTGLLLKVVKLETVLLDQVENAAARDETEAKLRALEERLAKHLGQGEGGMMNALKALSERMDVLEARLVSLEIAEGSPKRPGRPPGKK